MTTEDLVATRDRHAADQDSWDVRKVPDYGGSWTTHMTAYLLLAVENLRSNLAKQWVLVNIKEICESWGDYVKADRILWPIDDVFGHEFAEQVRAEIKEKCPKYGRYL